MRIALAPAQLPATLPTKLLGIQEPAGTRGRNLDHWELGRHANAITDGEVVTVGAFDRHDPSGRYAFAGGIGSAWRGVEILIETQEQGRQSAAVLDTIRGYIDSLTSGEQRLLNQVEVLARACPQDEMWRRRYGIPDYYVRALTGGGRTQFWRGNTRTLRVFHHEQAHVLDFAGNVNRRAWALAMDSDGRIVDELRSRGWKLTDLPVDQFDFDRDHLRLQSGGITGYAEFARANGNTNTEDIAEAIAWRKLGQRVGVIARGTSPDGTVRDFRFEDLFPARTALVDAAVRSVNSGGSASTTGDHSAVPLPAR